MRLALGTVQFGMAYGVSNQSGQVTGEQAANILDFAWRQGIRHLDTAADYGQAEDVLAHLLKPEQPFVVTSKTTRFTHGRTDVLSRARQSIAKLGRPHLDTILVHSAAELSGPEAINIWSDLLRLKEQGLVRRVGISCYAEDAPLSLVQKFKPDVIQVPLSVLDQRLLIDGQISAILNLNCAIQIRSVFLQGLMFMNPEKLPDHLQTFRLPLQEFHDKISLAGLSAMQAALYFAKNLPDLDCCLVGVTSRRELEEIVAITNEPTPDLDFSKFALHEDDMLNPARWPKPQPKSAFPGLILR